MPDDSDTAPPVPADVAVLSPAEKIMSPPVYFVPEPIDMRMSPDFPAVAAPVIIDTSPDVPELVVPEEKRKCPLIPVSPALTVRKTIDPLLVAVPNPVDMDTVPPVFADESPANCWISPPE
jgi:hypothetical protein